MAVILDIGDFIAEEYALSFSINGRRYECAYGEATVDEVLRMIAEEDATGAQVIDRRRKIVTTFLRHHLASGDAGAFEEDMKLVPFQSQRGALDIATLFDVLLGRIKKKPASGESPVRIEARAGSPGSSPS